MRNSAGLFTTDIDWALNAYGVNPGITYTSIPTEAKLREHIDGGRPVMIRYGYKSGGGHAVVAKGYEPLRQGPRPTAGTIQEVLAR